jgi:hypothetical protein
MDANKKKKKNLDGLPPLLTNPEFFGCLWCAKGLNFRKKAYEFINDALDEKRSESCLQKWYLYPERIPMKHRKIFVPLLIEGLHEAFREQRKFNVLNIAQIQRGLNEYQKLKEYESKQQVSATL